MASYSLILNKHINLVKHDCTHKEYEKSGCVSPNDSTIPVSQKAGELIINYCVILQDYRLESTPRIVYRVYG